MTLKILGSSSKGNCYILENENEALIIECGVKLENVKRDLNFQLRKVVGCLLTHEHGDHAKYVIDYMKAGLNVWSSEKTHEAAGSLMHHRACMIEPGHCRSMGGFTIKAFDVQHDAVSPLGFLINHNDTGNVLFLTDTFYTKYKFGKLHNIIVESNYSKEIIEKKRRDGYLPQFLNDRIIKSHMSLETCKELLQANDLTETNNIVLIHLSDGNSDAAFFQTEVKKLTGKTVHIADAGVVIENFNKTPF